MSASESSASQLLGQALVAEQLRFATIQAGITAIETKAALGMTVSAVFAPLALRQNNHAVGATFAFLWLAAFALYAMAVRTTHQRVVSGGQFYARARGAEAVACIELLLDATAKASDCSLKLTDDKACWLRTAFITSVLVLLPQVALTFTMKGP